MHFSTIISTALLGVCTVMASPAVKRNPPQPLCPPALEADPLCCATDVLGLADLDCAPPPSVPENISDFKSICASEGQQAKCCVVNTLDQALVCQNPE